MTVATTSASTATQLIPGDPTAIADFARQIRATSGTARPIIADQQRAASSVEAQWHGTGGQAAQARLTATGQMWTTTATVLDQLAAVVQDYAASLQTAQAGAAQALRYQDQAKVADSAGQTAAAYYYQAMAWVALNTARGRMYFAATTLTAAFGQATAALPKPGPPPAPIQHTAPACSTTDQSPTGQSPTDPWSSRLSSPLAPITLWPNSLYPPSALSPHLRAQLLAPPYQGGDPKSLHTGWSLEGFGFVGVTGEGEANHVGGWAFAGAFGSAGAKDLGTGDSKVVGSLGAIAGSGTMVETIPGVHLESGLLWEGGATVSRDGIKGFGSLSNPNLYFAATTKVGEVGTLILNEPGESCSYTVFAGLPIRHLGAVHAGPIEASAAVWAGPGVTFTVPSAATTPWQCIAILPESLRNKLPWWTPPNHQ